MRRMGGLASRLSRAASSELRMSEDPPVLEEAAQRHRPRALEQRRASCQDVQQRRVARAAEDDLPAVSAGAMFANVAAAPRDLVCMTRLASRGDGGARASTRRAGLRSGPG